MKRLISLMMLLAAGLLGYVGGCDDRSGQVPQAVLDQASKPPEDLLKPPTTQQLLTGHRSRTALLPLPLTMELPPGWGPDRRAHMANVMTGYTPSGNEVQIQLITRSSIKHDELDRLVTGAKKEMAAKPQQIVKVELRPLGSAQVLERQRIGEPAKLTTYDKNMTPHESMESHFTWTLNVMIPHEAGFQVHELSFLALTKNQYDQDKDFLNGVLSTLKYETGGDATTSTSTTAPSSTQPAISAPAAP
jgi:hypothetical protein